MMNGCCATMKSCCCVKPTLDCFVKLLGWTTMSYSVIDSSLLVSPSALFFFRLFVFLFCLYAYISHFVSASDNILDAVSWFEYLTHWDSCNMCIYFGLASWLTLQSIKDPSRSLTMLSSSKIACFTQFMFELTAVSAWLVSILYWTALYPVDPNPPQGYFAFINVCMHGLPAIWMLIEVFVGAQVLVQFHLWMLFIYFFAYLGVNAWIVLTTGVPIYSILTFKSTGSVTWSVIALVGVLVLWLLNYLFVRARERCCSSRQRSRSVVVFSKDAKPAADAPVV